MRKGIRYGFISVSLASIWFGCSNPFEKSLERSVYKRERLAGLSRVAYVSSVFQKLCFIQCNFDCYCREDVVSKAIECCYSLFFSCCEHWCANCLITSSLAKTTDSAAALAASSSSPCDTRGSIVPLVICQSQ